MKLHPISKSLGYVMTMTGIACALASLQGHAGTMGPVSTPGAAYIGVFGGAGASTHMDVSQYGTAFFIEAEGGPLAVNAFGKADSRTVGLVGGQVGYQWSELFLNAFNTFSGLSPAVELEGYYLGKSNFESNIVNNTTRLPAHIFDVTYPSDAGIFLVNAIANFNLSRYDWLHPYVGAGIGAGVLSINNASSVQIAPDEPGVNHYNSNTSDTEAAFAGQVKVGLNGNISQNLQMFIEYRWLYLASSSYTFGSTVYPAHAPTSPWLVKLDPQSYNMGAVGLRYTI